MILQILFKGEKQGMRALSKSLFILLIASLLLLSSLAQEAGSGDPVIEPNFGDDIKNSESCYCK